MVPPPLDPILIREHGYLDTQDLDTVLDQRTFFHNGFKSAKKYGLGYLNYNLALDKEIYDKSWSYMLRSHLYEHFTIYFMIYIGLLFLWIALFFGDLDAIHAIFYTSKRRSLWKYKKVKHEGKEGIIDDDEDIEYHHVKV